MHGGTVPFQGLLAAFISDFISRTSRRINSRAGSVNFGLLPFARFPHAFCASDSVSVSDSDSDSDSDSVLSGLAI